jgi:hypothetical protein
VNTHMLLSPPLVCRILHPSNAFAWSLSDSTLACN